MFVTHGWLLDHNHAGQGYDIFQQSVLESVVSANQSCDVEAQMHLRVR